MHACYTAGTEITLTSFWGQHIRQVAQTQLLILWKLLRFALEVFVSVFFVTFPFWSCSLQLWLLVPWLLYEERGGGQSIGVSECSNSAYISSSLCPGQRVQRLHAVFSIPSPPTRPLSLSPGFPTVLFLSALEFHLPARGQDSRGHAVCVCTRICEGLCVWMQAIGNISWWRKGNMNHAFLCVYSLLTGGHYLLHCLHSLIAL